MMRKDLVERINAALKVVEKEMLYADIKVIDKHTVKMWCSFRSYHEDLVNDYLNGRIFSEKQKLQLHFLSLFNYHVSDKEDGYDIVTLSQPNEAFNPIIECNGGHYKKLLTVPTPDDVHLTNDDGEQELVQTSDFWFHYFWRFPDDREKVV